MDIEEKNDYCQDIDHSLCFEELDPHMILTDFIDGEDNCNYELYMRDFLNNSSYFLNLSNGEKYQEPFDESKGQCDAITEGYEIDFKLLISTSKMNGNRILSESISKLCEGVHGFGPPQSRKIKEMTCTCLCQALRGKSIEELESIDSCSKKNLSEKDISKFLNILKKKKNLIFFYPYIFYYSEAKPYNVALSEIGKALFHDLKTSILFRNKYVMGKDTFLATLYDSKILFFKITTDSINLVDSVDVTTSKVFIDLFKISTKSKIVNSFIKY